MHNFNNIIRLALAICALVMAQSCRCARHETPIPDRSVSYVADEDIADTLDRLLDPALQYKEFMFVHIPADVPSKILKYPGYIVSFNPEYHQPNWVTWELTRDEAKADVVHRSRSTFQTDFDVEGCASTTDYRGSGMTRGHMCPAGDMRWHENAMDSCFLLTNISPQAEALNNGAWKNLEEKCRYWAQRDSAIIIICGPILSDTLTRTIGDTQIPVPERFFKVVLSPYSDNPKAIGFVMNNGRVEGGMQSAARSVDKIEEITGFDFFEALDDDIEDKIESECHFMQWNTR